MVKGEKPRIDESETGDGIAEKIIAERLMNAGLNDPGGEAAAIIRALNNAEYPVALVQKGRLMRLLDALEELQGREAAVASLLGQASTLLAKIREEAHLPPSK